MLAFARKEVVPVQNSIPVRVLVVDDSSLARSNARRLLEDMGLAVDEAADGAAGLERFYLNHPDLVLLDLIMPGIDGAATLMKLKELDPDVKIIVVSADVQDSTKAEVCEAGACAYITKPLTRNELIRTVKRVLEGETASSPGVHRKS